MELLFNFIFNPKNVEYSYAKFEDEARRRSSAAWARCECGATKPCQDSPIRIQENGEGELNNVFNHIL